MAIKYYCDDCGKEIKDYIYTGQCKGEYVIFCDQCHRYNTMLSSRRFKVDSMSKFAYSWEHINYLSNNLLQQNCIIASDLK